MTLLRVFTFLTGGVIAGEALALLIGMHLLSERGNPWLTTRNDILLAVDLLTGAALVALASLDRIGDFPWVFGAVLALAFLSHAFREWEYLAKAAYPFCANRPLFAVNNLKLAGVIVSAILFLGVRR